MLETNEQRSKQISKTLKVMHHLAYWAIKLGMTRNFTAYRLLALAAPGLLELALCLEEIYHPGNAIYWYWYDADGDDDDQNAEEIFELVDENICRAGTPYGNDNFAVVVEQYSPHPEDDERLHNLDPDSDQDYDWLLRTMRQRKLLVRKDLRGNRWKDWKRGIAREVVRELLRECQPTQEYPVVIVRSAVFGHAAERAYYRFYKQKKEGV